MAAGSTLKAVSNRQILIVEDDESIRQLVTTVLRKAGYGVTTAESGTQAIHAAKRLTPDLILMDIVMPDIDGYEATVRIKQEPDLEQVPIIFLSGRPPAEDGGRAFAAGGLAYIRKPFSSNHLLGVVSLALE